MHRPAAYKMPTLASLEELKSKIERYDFSMEGAGSVQRL